MKNALRLSRVQLALIIIFLVIIIDQIVKIWVKTHFYLGESHEVTSWFYIHFIENNGMAFGWELGSKLLLTVFRLVLTALLLVYMWKLRRRPDVKTGYMVCLALITAGALGNIIDCMFYGVIFDNPYPPQVATLFPDSGGYGTLFHGYVVDMLYFPLVSWYWPDWMPWIGGERFEFFQPVFNIADAAISVGIIALLLFYRSSLSKSGTDNETTGAPEAETTTTK
ncbi:MAG: lipoprotein signal peptidase [Clostridiales bacterium]|nr:lipoprotein signal peptidase [Clostridiales bacterium]